MHVEEKIGLNLYFKEKNFKEHDIYIHIYLHIPQKKTHQNFFLKLNNITTHVLKLR